MEDAAEHDRLARIELALDGISGDDEPELLGGRRLFLGLDLQTEDLLHQELRRLVRENDEPVEHPPEEGEGSRNAKKGGLRGCDSDHLRRLFADDHMKNG